SPRSPAWWACLGCGLIVLGCASDPPRALVVDLASDLNPGVDFDAARIEVQPLAAERPTWDERISMDAAEAASLAQGRRLVELRDVPEADYRVDVSLWLEETLVLRRRTTVLVDRNVALV